MRDGGQGCPRSEWRDLIENAEFAELQAFFDQHEVPNRNGQKGREGEQLRWAQFFRDHFVSAAAGSVRHGRRQGLRVDLYSSKGSLIPWENRLDLRVASTSPLELDGRLSVGTTADARTRLGIPRQRKDTRSPWKLFSEVLTGRGGSSME